MKNSRLVIILLCVFIALCVTYSGLYKEGFEPRDIEYVAITLQKEDRVRNMDTLEKKIGTNIKRIDAVVGKDVNFDDVTQFHPKMKMVNRELKQNEVGCYLSHYKVISSIDDKAPGYTVIFEDDATTEIDNFQETVASLIERIPDKNFDIIYLGILFDNNCKEKITNDLCSVDKSTYVVGAHGYLIKNSSARKIADNLYDIDQAIDHKLKALIDRDIIVAYIMNPSIVNQVGLSSTIQVESK
jgi:GR25 family glycosyltransferase involved in LPS biosynthesis